jgi:pimeloyl-ACP methyl ester carboxylesterase
MEAGDPAAPPLLLLHGIGANSMHWRHQFVALSDRFRVIAWNAPGYMLSDDLVTDTPSARDYADACVDFMDAAGIARADVLANSFGSRVAQYVAWFHPERITRMVLTGTAVVSRDLSAEAREQMLAAREAQVRDGGYRFGDRVTALLGPNASPATMAEIQHVLRATNPRGFLRAARSMAMNSDAPEPGAGMTMPILMIQGDADRVTPLETNARRLADILPHARLEVLTGIGHLPEAENPRVVNDLVLSFLTLPFPRRTGVTTLDDRYGLELSTTSVAARDAYVEGCDLILSGNPGAEAAFARAIAADPRFALAHVAMARGYQTRGEMPAAREAIAAANAVADGLPAREAGHLAFYNLVLAGRGDEAVTAAKEHLKHWPRDAMVLTPCSSVFGLIGFSGRAGREREQVELLAGFANDYGEDWWFLAQYAFALMETGQRDAARPMIERAMALNPRNAHGAHIRAHMYYEDGEPAASRAYLREWLRGYSREGQLWCHLNWHRALCELDIGDFDEAFEIYNGNIAPGSIWGPPLNVLTDTVSFLWRAELAGHPRDPGSWRVVNHFANQTFPRAGVAFADVHGFLAASLTNDAVALFTRSRKILELEHEGRCPAGPTVRALAIAFASFRNDDYQKAIAAIEPILKEHERIGGSRAQRDLIEFTLLRAYVMAGRFDDASRYVRERRDGPSRIPVAGAPAH